MSYLSADIENKIKSMNRVLMIAYHFPPIQGSSGVHRTVQFARHLPGFGWAPIIVAPHPRAYPEIGSESWATLPEEAIVQRTFALDSARHLSLKGRYVGATAIPDRWISWFPGAVFECLRLIRKYKPHVLWSTFPIATAHLIGLAVSRLSGLPWVADFRDPMVQKGLPASQVTRKVYKWLEKEVVRYSSCCTLVTRSALDDYKMRYPEKQKDRWQLIENGYDESLFEPFDHIFTRYSSKPAKQKIKILHSGILYSSGRNPFPFLKAIKSILEQIDILVEVVFRGCGDEKVIGEQVNALELAGVVKLSPPISYDEAIKEMIESDVLALFQGSVYNRQIPAKVYEYLRAGRPILALTDENGETARMLRDWDGVYLADMESQESIECTLLDLMNDIKGQIISHRKKDSVQSLSRYAGAGKLNQVLHEVKNAT